MHSLSRAIDWFVPATLDALEQRSRARSFVLVCFGMVSLIALGLVGWGSLDREGAAPMRVVGALCAALLLLPFALRVTGNLELARWLFTSAIALGPVAGALETRLGVHAPIMVVSAITPILACAFLGRRGAVVFSAVSFASIVSVYVLAPDAIARLAALDGASASATAALALLACCGGALGTMLDAERRSVHERLRESETHFRLLAEDAADVVFRMRIAPTLELEYANRAFERLLGVSVRAARENLAVLFAQAIPAEDRPALHAKIMEFRGHAPELVQFRVRSQDGSLRWLEARCSVKREHEAQFVIGVCRDVTVSKEAEAKLSYAASHDALTGLANRRAFEERLAQALATKGQGVALLYIDLDGLKQVNDKLGHELGDALLCSVGKRLTRSIRERDLAFRLGGDEFTVLLEGVAGRELAHGVAMRVLDGLSAPFQVRGHTLSVSASIGVARARDNRTCDELVALADAAMYRAKRAGGARIEHDASPSSPLESGIVETGSARFYERDERSGG
jgi:diguanylate cyclase (GGDEF)-like protein/PAS domain S-box-containing protein